MCACIPAIYHAFQTHAYPASPDRAPIAQRPRHPVAAAPTAPLGGESGGPPAPAALRAAAWRIGLAFAQWVRIHPPKGTDPTGGQNGHFVTLDGLHAIFQHHFAASMLVPLRPPIADSLAAISHRFCVSLAPKNLVSPLDVYESIAAPKSNFHSLKALGSSQGQRPRDQLLKSVGDAES